MLYRNSVETLLHTEARGRNRSELTGRCQDSRAHSANLNSERHRPYGKPRCYHYGRHGHIKGPQGQKPREPFDQHLGPSPTDPANSTYDVSTGSRKFLPTVVRKFLPILGHRIWCCAVTMTPLQGTICCQREWMDTYMLEE